jgi:hypothetical protein
MLLEAGFCLGCVGVHLQKRDTTYIGVGGAESECILSLRSELEHSTISLVVIVAQLPCTTKIKTQTRKARKVSVLRSSLSMAMSFLLLRRPAFATTCLCDDLPLRRPTYATTYLYDECTFLPLILITR